MEDKDLQLIHKFVDDGLEELKRLGLRTTTKHIPLSMQEGDYDQRKEYNNWKAAPSTVSDKEIQYVEKKTGSEFPESFKAFLNYKYFFDLFLPGVEEVRFYPHSPIDWMEKYINMYSYDWVKEELLKNKLIPFADHEDWGILCFDARTPKLNNEYPIMMIDHELLGEIHQYKLFNVNFMEMVKERLIYKDR